MAKYEEIETTLRNVYELETFVHELLGKLPTREVRHGESLVPYAEKLGVRIPDFLQSTEVTWDKSAAFEPEAEAGQVLVLTRPGKPQVLGLTIGCIRIGSNVKVCLECGWLWCRIVIVVRL